MNYACLDARVLSNTSAIIIETIEKTIPDGSIIRQQEGETWSGRSPACPANLTTMHMEGTFTDTSWSPSVHNHVLCDTLNSVCVSVRALIWKGYCKLSQWGSLLSQCCSSSGSFPIKNSTCYVWTFKSCWVSKLCGSVATARNSACVLFVKTLSPWISSLTLFIGVLVWKTEAGDWSFPPALHFHKSILRTPSRSITLTGLLARATIQGDHHKTTCHKAISHLAMPLKQPGKQRQCDAPRANICHKHLWENMPWFTAVNRQFKVVVK